MSNYEFVKHDSDKIKYIEILNILGEKGLFAISPEDLKLIPEGFINELCAVLRHGADKYGVDNWRKCKVDDAIDRYSEAAVRHAVSIQRGEVLDQDSKLNSAAHLACNAAFLVHFTKILQYQRGQEHTGNQ